MTKYLTHPCPYKTCGEKTVQRVTETKAICTSCNRKVGYKVMDHVDGSKSYELKRLGREGGEKTFIFTVRLPVRMKGVTGGDVKLALDRAIDSGIIIL